MKAKLKQLDAFKHKEGETYKSGQFHFSDAKARNPPKCKVCKRLMKGHSQGDCHPPAGPAALNTEGM